MAARTTDEILAQILALLPDRFAGFADVIGGGAAGLAAAEAFVEELVTASTIDGAEGVFLRLRAAGFGVYLQGTETDASIRTRIQTVDEQVTKPMILAAVNRLLYPYTGTQAHILERRDGPVLDGTFVLGASRLTGWNHFVLVVPQLGDPYGGAVALGSRNCTLNKGFVLGRGAGWHPVYPAIIALVRRIRAAGIRVSLVIEE